MEDFAENARPTPEGIAVSLAILRKEQEPFAADALASRLDLLFLPFLKGLSTSEQRVGQLQVALRLAAGRLETDHAIAYRHVFLEPVEKKVDERRIAALNELQDLVPFRELKTPAAVARIEERMLPVLAEMLLDPEFERELERRSPMPERKRRSSGPTHAYELLSYELTVDVDGEDFRKKTEYRRLDLRILLPDQQVVGIRYFNHGSDPKPIENGVTMLSHGHTYLGTLADTPEGSAVAWMMHFVHLGGRPEPGDIISLEMREEYFDELSADPHPYLTGTVYNSSMEKVSLAVRLPIKKLRRRITAESRVIKEPHTNHILVERKRLAVEEDGWFRARFSDVQVNCQYGIFFPRLDIYK